MMRQKKKKVACWLLVRGDEEYVPKRLEKKGELQNAPDTEARMELKER